MKKSERRVDSTGSFFWRSGGRPGVGGTVRTNLVTDSLLCLSLSFCGVCAVGL